MSRFGLLVSCLLLFFSSPVAAQEQFLDSHGVKIHYTVEGQGEPVLLLHGFGQNAELWTGVRKALATEYRVIAMDFRGHGKSEKPHSPEKYGLEMVEDVPRLLKHLNIKQGHIIGYSMGGAVTGKLLVTHPKIFLSAVLGGAAPGPSAVMDAQTMTEIANSLEQGKGFGPLIPRLTPAGQPLPSEQQMKQMSDRVLRGQDPQALAAVLRGMSKVTDVSADKLKKIRIPVLALVGTLDPMLKDVQSLKDKMPQLEIITLDGADHLSAVSRPAFAKSLQEFLQKHRKAAQK